MLQLNWTRSARIQLKGAYDYIKRDSPANAEKVRKKIFAATASIHENPKKYPADKDKIDNDDNYRAFVVYRYRISYLIQETKITILRVRHTSMEPTQY